jgi:hypothetical protein
MHHILFRFSVPWFPNWMRLTNASLKITWIFLLIVIATFDHLSLESLHIARDFLGRRQTAAIVVFGNNWILSSPSAPDSVFLLLAGNSLGFECQLTDVELGYLASTVTFMSILRA